MTPHASTPARRTAAGGPARRRATPLGAADWLSLAAAPTFAGMALVTALLGDGPMDAFCAAGQGGAWPGGMVPMYLLMSVFHTAPWLRFLSGRQSGIRLQ